MAIFGKAKKISLSGVQIIEEQIGKFQGIIEKLEQGAEKCAQAQQAHSATIVSLEHSIDGLRKENDMLGAQINKAKTIQNNIRAILGENTNP